MSEYSKAQLVLGMIIDEIRGEDRPSTTHGAYQLAGKILAEYEGRYRNSLGAKIWEDTVKESRRYAVRLIGKKETIKVLYLVHQDLDGEEDVYAYFPDEIANTSGDSTVYAHIGQHSACTPAYADESRPATEEEREDLHKELVVFIAIMC